MSVPHFTFSNVPHMDWKYEDILLIPIRIDFLNQEDLSNNLSGQFPRLAISMKEMSIPIYGWINKQVIYSTHEIYGQEIFPIRCQHIPPLLPNNTAGKKVMANISIVIPRGMKHRLPAQP